MLMCGELPLSSFILLRGRRSSRRPMAREKVFCRDDGSDDRFASHATRDLDLSAPRTELECSSRSSRGVRGERGGTSGAPGSVRGSPALTRRSTSSSSASRFLRRSPSTRWSNCFCTGLLRVGRPVVLERRMTSSNTRSVSLP